MPNSVAAAVAHVLQSTNISFGLVLDAEQPALQVCRRWRRPYKRRKQYLGEMRIIDVTKQPPVKNYPSASRCKQQYRFIAPACRWNGRKKTLDIPRIEITRGRPAMIGKAVLPSFLGMGEIDIAEKSDMKQLLFL